MRKRSELLISVLQIPVDYLMLVVSFVLAYFVRQGSGYRDEQAWPLARAQNRVIYLNGGKRGYLVGMDACLLEYPQTILHPTHRHTVQYQFFSL